MESSPRTRDDPLNRLLSIPEEAVGSLDMIVPDEDTIAFLYNSKFFDRVAGVVKRGQSKPISVRVACVFNRRMQIIRRYSPFIRFYPLWPGAFKSTRLVVIVDDRRVVTFGGSEHSKTEEQTGSVESLARFAGSYSSQEFPYLVSCWVDLFQRLVGRKIRYEEIDEESNYSNLLLDLLTHDIGNYHQTILLGKRMR